MENFVVKIPNSKLGFGKSMNFVRICDLKTLRSTRRRVSFIRNSNQDSDLAELQPASEGSPLLGISIRDYGLALDFSIDSFFLRLQVAGSSSEGREGRCLFKHNQLQILLANQSWKLEVRIFLMFVQLLVHHWPSPFTPLLILQAYHGDILKPEIYARFKSSR